MHIFPYFPCRHRSYYQKTLSQWNFYLLQFQLDNSISEMPLSFMYYSCYCYFWCSQNAISIDNLKLCCIGHIDSHFTLFYVYYYEMKFHYYTCILNLFFFAKNNVLSSCSIVVERVQRFLAFTNYMTPQYVYIWLASIVFGDRFNYCHKT